MGTKSRSKDVIRADGKASKEAILEATLIIIMRDGMRSVKYKTVAEVAGVTTSATSYYFRDIPALITEAYLYYFESYKAEMDKVRNIGTYLLDQFDASRLHQADTLNQFINAYTDTLIKVIAAENKDAEAFFVLDRIFRNEVLQNPSMYPALKRQDRLDIEALEKVFVALGATQPEEDATHLMSLLGYLSEKILHEGVTDELKAYAGKMIKSLLKKSILPASL